MPRCEQVGSGPGQGFALVDEHLQCQTGIQLRIVQLPPPEPAVLIVLHEMVIGVAREGQRTETQRVHRGQPEQPEVRVRGSQVGQVEGDEVVAEDKGRAFSEIVEPVERRAHIAPRMNQALAGVRPHRAERVNDPILLADLQVQRDAVRQEGIGGTRGSAFHGHIVSIRGVGWRLGPRAGTLGNCPNN